MIHTKMKYKIYNLLVPIFFLIFFNSAYSQKLLIPMDLSQTDHLKAYGITYWHLTNGGTAEWLLNYRGGSFMFDYTDNLAAECRIRGVFFERISDGNGASILEEVRQEG